MLCYKDQTYCKSDCTNKECHRFLSDDVREGSQKAGLPLALCDFSKDCYEYRGPFSKIKEGKDENNNRTKKS